MRILGLAAITAAALVSVAPASAFAGDWRTHPAHRNYYRAGVDIDAIRDRCRSDWARAHHYGDTGGWSRRAYMERCIDRNVDAAQRHAGGRYYRHDWRR
jgi:hypothetical protein